MVVKKGYRCVREIQPASFDQSTNELFFSDCQVDVMLKTIGSLAPPHGTPLPVYSNVCHTSRARDTEACKETSDGLTHATGNPSRTCSPKGSEMLFHGGN
jgi:hypothetical protein